MTFAQYASKSVSSPRILVDVDIAQENVQWVNYGAGIWKCNFENLYPEVDSSLLDGFSAQAEVIAVGSVFCDALPLTKTTTMALFVATVQAFFYDGSTKTLYVNLPDYDEPILHFIEIGVTYGISNHEFTPVGSAVPYEGRLQNIPSIGFSRDPLYFGKIAFSSVNIDVINADGYFDRFAIDNNIYGNEIRIYVGYDDLDIADYLLAYTGYIENITIDEESMSLSVVDKRKQLSKAVNYSCTNKNALDAIVELLELMYPALTYSAAYFNTTDWDAATLLAPSITLVGDANNPIAIIELIETICTSIFGLFIVESDGRYSFKYIDSNTAPVATIPKEDVITLRLSVKYDPTEILSSVRVVYGTASSVLIDTSVEEAVFLKYKTYKQHSVETCLPDATAASVLATTILDYAKDVHGTLSIEVPMSYYSIELGDIVLVTVDRPASDMLGVLNCEVLSKKYNLLQNTITLDLRVVAEVVFRVTVDGSYRFTKDAEYRVGT